MQLDLEELISLQEDTHANHSAKQVGDKAKKMNVISGQKCYELSKVANHDTLWLKMLLVMSQWASTRCLLTWKIKDTPQGRLLYQLVPKTHHIDETEFGSSDSLLPTPAAYEDRTSVQAIKKLPKDRQKMKMSNLSTHVRVTQDQMWPTPTAMDTKEDGLKHATKILQGKTHRASGQPIQKTLSDKVMMDLIVENPELMEIYQDHQIEERPYLPTQQEFVDYLRMQTTIKELASNTNIKRTTIEHWFRKDKKGFSYPSIEDWQQIKPLLKTIQFDQEMTTIQSKEWKTKNQMWPTPTASDVEGGVAKDVQTANGRFFRQNEKGEKWGVKLRDAVNHTEEKKLWPTPAARDHKGGYIGGRYKDGKPNNNTLDTQVQFVSNQKKEQKQLSAKWVTWLMGYPQGYLDISTENQNISQELQQEKKTEPKS